MTFLETQQSLEQIKQDWLNQWYQRSKSHNSRNGAKTSLHWFETFLHTAYNSKTEREIIEELKVLSYDHTRSTQLYLFVNAFVQYLNTKGLSPRAIRIYTMFVKSYLRYHGIKIYTDDIKEFVNFPKIIKERRQPLTIESIRKLLEATHEKRLKGIMLTAASSGARIGEILQSTVRDFDFKHTPVRFRIRAETTKTREEHETFISQEATNVVKLLIKDKKEDDLIFCRKWNTTTLPSVETYFANIRKQAGLTDKYANGMYKVNIHAFRAFFFTKATKRHD